MLSACAPDRLSPTHAPPRPPPRPPHMPPHTPSPTCPPTHTPSHTPSHTHAPTRPPHPPTHRPSLHPPTHTQPAAPSSPRPALPADAPCWPPAACTTPGRPLPCKIHFSPQASEPLPSPPPTLPVSLCCGSFTRARILLSIGSSDREDTPPPLRLSFSRRTGSPRGGGRPCAGLGRGASPRVCRPGCWTARRRVGGGSSRSPQLRFPGRDGCRLGPILSTSVPGGYQVSYFQGRIKGASTELSGPKSPPSRPTTRLQLGLCLPLHARCGFGGPSLQKTAP